MLESKIKSLILQALEEKDKIDKKEVSYRFAHTNKCLIVLLSSSKPKLLNEIKNAFIEIQTHGIFFY